MLCCALHCGLFLYWWGEYEAVRVYVDLLNFIGLTELVAVGGFC